ncbi:MAG: DUF932 domain-containing protein [Verrucomicrobia bacterium]|nr:DUF932 domain-containing protein [Verrucomicrobiota bacterium]
MAHRIESPYDIVFSDQGKEWHGLARVVKRINRKTLSPLFFKLIETDWIEGAVTGLAGNGCVVRFPESKGIVADLRGRGDLNGNPDIIPMAVLTDQYRIIENETVFQAVERALDGLEHRVTTAGTLDRCRRFFVTVALEKFPGFEAGGDRYLSYLNFVTSHDGTVALQFYDSTTRIVCNNTLNMSLVGAKTMQVKIRHLPGAETQLTHISEVLNTVLEGRGRFATALDGLARKRVNEEETRDVITGWQYERLGKPPVMSARTRNAIGEICRLFSDGSGNQGRTRYDVWNGLTDYYSNGSGVGIKATSPQRTANALFGHAANLKIDFTKRILEEGGWESMVESGRAANPRGTSVFIAREKEGAVGKN